MPSPAQTETPPLDAAASLEDASARLEAALARLEALVETGPLQSDTFRVRQPKAAALAGAGRDTRAEELDAPRNELAAARAREQALDSAASQAALALGQAMGEIRHLLHGDAEEAPPEDDGDQPELDLDAESAEDTGP